MDYSVSQINAIIGRIFKSEIILNSVSIKGEISNLKSSPSGHVYFSLKDEKSVIPCVMFAGSARGLKFKPKDGNSVIASGSVEVYEAGGRYQVIVKSLRLDGDGDLLLKFQALKQELEEAGYFSDIYKKPIEKYAKRIGVVTSPTGAVIQDIRNVSKRRNPYVELILYPSLVQGDEAVPNLIKGLEVLDGMNLDTIIIGRGGGSIEDLWCFNDERLAKAIFKCNTPIISAVGHETDFTICDFVSDLRAPTPSAAAELSVFDYAEFINQLKDFKARLRTNINKSIINNKSKVEEYGKKIKLLSPLTKINNNKQRLCDLTDKIESSLKHKLSNRKNDLVNINLRFENSINKKTKDRRNLLSIYAERLKGLSPLEKLSKGFAYVETKDNKGLTDIALVNEGDMINVHLKNGDIEATVNKLNSVKRK